MKEIRTNIPYSEIRYFDEGVKGNGVDYYMCKLGNMFDRLECFSKFGSPLSGGGFQWVAYAKHLEGDDDVWEGSGDTPFEAIRDLYKTMKDILNEYGKQSETGLSEIFR